MSSEEVRQLMYVTFVNGGISELDYWYDKEYNLKEDFEDELHDAKNKNQEKVRQLHSIPGIRFSIISALLSTGVVLSPESAITVFSVSQEYDIAEQLGVPSNFLVRQSL